MQAGVFLTRAEPLSSPRRLTQAVLDGWSLHGKANLSARSLAQSASLPVSSIYHHFGSMERLYEMAQDEARKDAERWCAAQIDAVAGASELSPAAFPSWLAALIDDWSSQHRRLAFAWWECQRLASQDNRYLPAYDAWRALWASFWREICNRCGRGSHSERTDLLFNGESGFHLMQWRSVPDRACLEELCSGWAKWLDGEVAPEGPWRRFARSEATRSMPTLPVRGGVAERIAVAAAETVEQHGVAALTHRAVAARAGVTLGLVSYNFRTTADLARVAFEMIYRRVVPVSDREEPKPKKNTEEAIERVVQYYKASPRLQAFGELLAASARDPSLAEFRPQLRYLRGRNSSGILNALFGEGRTISPLDGAIFSSFGSGLWQACIGKNPEEIDTFVRRELNGMRALFDKA